MDLLQGLVALIGILNAVFCLIMYLGIKDTLFEKD